MAVTAHRTDPNFYHDDINDVIHLLGRAEITDVNCAALSASRLVSTGADKLLASTDASAWIAGTANRVTVTDDGDGTVTLSGPQDLATTSSPQFAGLTLTGLETWSTAASIEAVNPGAQGDGALTKTVNEVATVGAGADAVTLPEAAAGVHVVIINNGANSLEIWPASGDNAGGGVDTAVNLAAGSNVHYVAYDAANWEAI